MATVFLVKGRDPVNYMDDVLAVYGNSDDAYAFKEHYKVEAETAYALCDYESEYYNYYTYDVVEMEVM